MSDVGSCRAMLGIRSLKGGLSTSRNTPTPILPLKQIAEVEIGDFDRSVRWGEEKRDDSEKKRSRGQDWSQTDLATQLSTTGPNVCWSASRRGDSADCKDILLKALN